MKQEFKKGISLIAVLMFMLAATTASIVVYNLIGSENFASGSRLKRTEAYKAAESGVEATQAWLSNKGADVGALVTAYFEDQQRRHIKLTDAGNNVLGMMRPNSDDRQKFDVYLVGVDAAETNSPYLKLKFISVGQGRDNSEVKLSAIFDVAGLYQTKVPTQIKRSIPVDFDWQYFGGSLKFAGDKSFSSAAINGDWDGNPPTIENNFIVTGNFKGSGNEMKVGGTLCVGGEYDPDNNAKVKDAYIGSGKNFVGTYENVYCAGEMKIGHSQQQGAAINGSFTINGRLYDFLNKVIQVGGDMVIEDPGYIDGDGMQNTGRFFVCGSVWSNNVLGVRSDETNGAKIRFNEGSGCTANNSAILAFTGANRYGNTTLYETGGSPKGYFTSSKTNDNPTDANKPLAASPVKDYCDEIWKPASGGSGCAGSQYIIDDPIASSLSDIEAFLERIAGEDGYDNNEVLGNNFKCINNEKTDILSNGKVLSQNGPTFTEVLNECYTRLMNKPSKLYNGYLVVKLDQTENIGRVSPELNGKFIFIYPNSQNFVTLPQTAEDSRVMVFFKHGVSSELKSSRCPGFYNYFIYSLEDINRLNEWETNCPLNGNIYFPGGSCAKVGDANNGFKVVSNKGLVEDLMEAGILCNRGNGTGDCTAEEIKNTQDKVDPNGTENAYYNSESRWLPISSRLKVSLASKNISRETISETGNPILERSVVVMPRVVRLTTDAYKNDPFASDPNPLRRFYTFMYLNGATPAQEPGPTCESVQGGSSSTPPTTVPQTGVLTEGFFRCAFSDAAYSDFYVIVKGESGGATVRLSGDQTIGKGEPSGTCKTMSVMATENNSNFSLDIATTKLGSGWAVSLVSSRCQTSEAQNQNNDKTWTINCNNQTTDVTIATFNVCSSNSDDDMQVDFEIRNPSGVTSVPPFNSKVYREMPDMEIQRANMGNIVSCPSRLKGSATWLTLDCSEGAIITNTPNENWTCPLHSSQNVTYHLSPPTGCELPTGTPENGTVPTGNGSTSITFPMDLAWKSYTVTVNGGNLSFSTEDQGVPSNERNSNGATSSFKVYHGATYTLSYSGTAKEATCGPSLACNASPMYFPTPNGGTPRTITPTGDGTITLANISPPTAQCEQSIPQQKAGVPFKFGLIAPVINVTGYECDADPYPMISYSVSPGGEYAQDANVSNLAENTYAVTATVTCGGSGINNTSSVSCGDLVIVPALLPTIKCELEENRLENGEPVWYVDDSPKLKVTVTNGEAILCSELPALSGILSASSWNRSGTQNTSTPSAASIHTFTGPDLSNSHKGNYNSGSINANITCGNTVLPTAACPAFEVKAAPPCDYQAEWCGGKTIDQVVDSAGAIGAFSTAGKCFFIKSAGNSMNTNQQGTIYINGEATTGSAIHYNASAINDKTKKDGGYYIYFPGSQWYQTDVAEIGIIKSSCFGPTVPTVTCSWAGSGQTLFSGDLTPEPPTLECSTGGTADGANWGISLPPTPTIHTLGTAIYSPELTGSITCDGEPIGNESIDCGTLTVKAIPSITSCVGESGESVTLPDKPTQPVITLNDQSNVCSNSGSSTPNNSWTNVSWTVSKGGTDVSNPAWNNIFDAADSYASYRVSGKCGDYPTNLTATCSGSAEVSGAAVPSITAAGENNKISNIANGGCININYQRDFAPTWDMPLILRCSFSQQGNDNWTITNTSCSGNLYSVPQCNIGAGRDILFTGTYCLNIPNNITASCWITDN